MEVEDSMLEVESDLTEQQKASLQMYEKNKVELDKMLDQISEGLTELKDHALLIGNEIDRQNEYLHELENAMDNTTETIARDRERLKQHRKRETIRHCGVYLFCIILILVVVIIILGILRRAFSYDV